MKRLLKNIEKLLMEATDYHIMDKIQWKSIPTISYLVFKIYLIFS